MAGMEVVLRRYDKFKRSPAVRRRQRDSAYRACIRLMELSREVGFSCASKINISYEVNRLA